MKICSFGTDGGKESGVTGFWLLELKNWFSIVLLRFKKGTRENYHSHAFNAYTWWLWGKVEEQHVDNEPMVWTPSVWPKYTPRSTFHRVNALETTYAMCFRGPWSDTWQEYDPKTSEFIDLTHGRQEVARTKRT